MLQAQHPMIGYRNDFPALNQRVAGHPLIYFDNAATTQKPEQVIEAISDYYRYDNANVHRGVHELSQRATQAYEGVRPKLLTFFDAGSDYSVIFTRGVTEGINLLAQTIGKQRCVEGDTILLTELEHHSNLVPWQMLAKETGARLDFIPVDENGVLLLDQLESQLSQGVKLVSLTHISNTLGTVNPVQEIIELAHKAGALVIVDGAQSCGHSPISLKEMNPDFYVFSGHKMMGPMGVGGVIGRTSLLESMPPWQGGGEMISRVEYHDFQANEVPQQFEAGTPNVEGVVGLGAALDYLESIGMDRIQEYESELTGYGYEALTQLSGLTLYGPNPDEVEERGATLSFTMPTIHAHDLVSMMDMKGVALRGGHHCNQPLMRKLGVPATVRASFAFYNTKDEMDSMISALKEVISFFRR
ncbi:MAG: cysteine desulfurase [Verrucomicrobiota bacterium]